MERFFIPIDRKMFIKWLLQTSIRKDWTIVLEYSDENASEYLKSIATEVPLPNSCVHEYSSGCKFIAIQTPVITDVSVDKIIAMTHVLSVHYNDVMIFLIADDYHEECFSGRATFADTYQQELLGKNLVDRIEWRRRS